MPERTYYIEVSQALDDGRREFDVLNETGESLLESPEPIPESASLEAELTVEADIEWAGGRYFRGISAKLRPSGDR